MVRQTLWIPWFPESGAPAVRAGIAANATYIGVSAPIGLSSGVLAVNFIEIGTLEDKGGGGPSTSRVPIYVLVFLVV